MGVVVDTSGVVEAAVETGSVVAVATEAVEVAFDPSD